MCEKGFIYFTEFACVIVEEGDSKISRMDWQAKDTEKIFCCGLSLKASKEEDWRPKEELMLQLKSKGCLLAEVSFAQERSIFGFIEAANWLDEAHLHRGEQLLYSRSANLNIHLIQKTLIETSKILLEHISMHRDPVKMTCESNHHTIWFSFSTSKQIC